MSGLVSCTSCGTVRPARDMHWVAKYNKPFCRDVVACHRVLTARPSPVLPPDEARRDAAGEQS